MRCLIVGQGIAGTVLAWTLMQRDVEVIIADADFPHQSSGAAAGIINPVTGKRFVKSWRFDECFPAARDFYLSLEAALHCQVWEESSILRLLQGHEEINNWSARIGTADYAGLLGERSDAGAWAGLVPEGFYLGEIKKAARVDFPVLLRAFREKAVREGFFREEKISAAAAANEARGFDFVIFCEGYRGSGNPYFPGLGWQLAKGEGLVFRFPQPGRLPLRDMVKRNLMVVPLGGDLFWAGASYNWNFEDNGASNSEQAFLEERLSAMLAVPYEVVHRFGAIRPTVRDRRPFLGISALHRQMAIFNGLGTKGALLAPFWAARLADLLLDKIPLDAEVDVQRFR
ncbi:MAG: FAD-binding oxidoreductase [Saprospiraceae bacterium]|nr:FAD-binding oxidoreductase [Saprospiraceae bacterium]